MARNRSKNKPGWISPKKERLLGRKTLNYTDITPFNAVRLMNGKDLIYPIWPGYGNIYKS